MVAINVRALTPLALGRSMPSSGCARRTYLLSLYRHRVLQRNEFPVF